MKQNMKGFWHMAESIITATILISFLMAIGNQAFTNTYHADMSIEGYKKLSGLAQKDSFRSLVYSGDMEGVRNEIEAPGYYYNVSICSLPGECTGFDPINTESTIWASSYIFSGNESYEPIMLRLYIWR